MSARAVDEFCLYVLFLCSLFCSCVLSRRLCAGLLQFYSSHPPDPEAVDEFCLHVFSSCSLFCSCALS